MGQTHQKQARLKPRKKPRVSETQQERDIEIYQSHMKGNSVRAVQELFEIKSTRTVHDAIKRGREIVKERGIDLDVRRIEIDVMFRNTLGHLAGEIQRQADEGRIVQISRNDGSTEVRRTKGIDPRTAEALARSADRWAQFLGETDRATEVNAPTVIQLAAPADGAAFANRWNSAEPAVDVKATTADQQLPEPSGSPSGVPS